MSERTDDATPLEHNGIEHDTGVAGEQVDGGDRAVIARIGDALDVSAAESGDEAASSSDERIEDVADVSVPGSDGNAAISSGDDAGDAAISVAPGTAAVSSRIVDQDSSSAVVPTVSEQASGGVDGVAGRTDTPPTSGGGEESAASAAATEAVSSPIVDADSAGTARPSVSEQMPPSTGDGDGVAGGPSKTQLGGGRDEATSASATEAVSSPIVDADSSGTAESSISEQASPSTEGGGPSETRLGSGGGEAAVSATKTARATKNKKDAAAGSDDEVAEFTPEPLDDDEFRSALEALLLIVDAPAPVELLADALQDKPARVERALHEMAAELSARASGIDLRFVGDGWRFYTRSEYAPYVERMLLDGARSKLTRAALETLAVVAYRQPVTRTRVSAVRGVNVDGVMRTLLARGLIAEAGVDPETNGTQYCTTELFLERIGLASLSDLPPLAPLLPGVDLIDEINESLDTDPRYTRLKKSAETDLDLGTED